MRRNILFLTATVGVVALLGLSGFNSSGSTGSQPLSREDSLRGFARRLLAQPNVHLSAMGETGLRTMAAGTRQWDPGDQGIDSDEAGPSTGGLAKRKLPASLPNVRVNDPSKDTHGEDQTTQSETTIAASGSNVAVGYNDSQRALLFLTAGASITGYSYSTDGGAHFTDGGALPNHPGFVNGGDPWMTTDRSGGMYFANLMFGALAGEVGVAKSTDGGKTWTQPVIAQPTPSLKVFYFADKEAMTAGPDPSQASRDNVYLAWDDFEFTPRHFYTGLPVSHSYDGGKTWTRVYVNRFDNFADGCSFGQYFGAQPIVNPSDGTLYVAAEKISADYCKSAEVAFSEVVFKSTDGGQTFGPEVKIADITGSTLLTPGLILGPGRIMRLADFPTLAFLGSDLYAAWNERESGHVHIRIARSSNGGESWTVADATSGFGDEAQPALSNDSTGVHLLYYERNQDNTLDVYVANSSNGSVFVPKLVTTQSFPGTLTWPQFDPIIAFGYMGDYIANVSHGATQYFSWGDNRDSVSDFLYPSGRADPDVFFAKQ